MANPLRFKSSFRIRPLVCIATGALLLTSVFTMAQSQKPPYDKERLLKVVKLNALTTQEIIDAVNTRGVDFRTTSDVESEFRQAGARPELVEALKKNYRNAQPPPNRPAPPRTGTPPTTPPRANVPPGPPLSKAEIVTMLQGGLPSSRVEQFIEVRGVNFAVTAEISREILAAGGSRTLLGLISEKSRPSSPPTGNPNTNIDRRPAVPAGPDYDDLNQQAMEAMQGNRAPEAMRYLQQALRLDANKPTAYQLMGFLQIYGYQNIVAAEQNFRNALQRNGYAIFRVYHDHDNLFGSYCQGTLFITKTGVTFKADDGNHTFEAQDAMIKEASINDFVGAAFGAFHIKVKEGEKNKSKNYNFAPATQKKQESGLIVNLIRSY
jgi:hypothetical protein